jgi:hypothetical protein
LSIETYEIHLEMYFYMLRLNVVPIDNPHDKRLIKIGITENIAQRLEEHKNIVGGYEILRIIEDNCDILKHESDIKSSFLPFHGKEIFLLDSNEISLDFGNDITAQIKDQMKPAICQKCKKATLCLLFHKCKLSPVETRTRNAKRFVTQLEQAYINGIISHEVYSLVLHEISKINNTTENSMISPIISVDANSDIVTDSS